MLCRLILLLLLVGPATGFAQEDTGLFTPEFPSEEFAARRMHLYEAIGPRAMAVVQGASAPHSSARFRQSNQFFYLTGVETPNAYVLLNGETRQTTLYLPHRNASRSGTEGGVLTADEPDLVRQLTGIDAIAGTDLLGESLARLGRNQQIQYVYTPLSPAEGPSASRDGELRVIADIASDPWDGRPAREGHLVQQLQTTFPSFEVRDLSPLLDEMRLIKSAREIRLIKRATKLSGEAIIEAMRSTEPGVAEHEIDALSRFIFYRHGAQGEGYAAIVATGPNAYFPHHRAAGSVMQDGDLVVMDYAPDIEYYRSDLTRTWPVSGHFNQWQRELYGFYLACYKAILYRIRPGVTAAQIRQEAVLEMDQILSEASFSSSIHEQAASDFVDSYRASSRNPDSSLGHWVGMSTHDPGINKGVLKPGMVFTIEPALRVPEEQIYIRAEDLIIITDEGVEIPSLFLPIEIDEIEQLMTETGILQQYPRFDFSE